MRIKINNKIFKTKLAVTKNERARGMSKKRFTDEYDSMLFIQNDGNHCFWMNECIIPLDIIFIKNNTITKIHHNCQPCIGDECKSLCGQGEMVLEIEGGSCDKYDIKEGNTLSFLF